MHHQRGFTLAELLIVLSIILVLITAGMTLLSQSTKRARDAKRIQDIQAIRNALELFYQDNGHYPGPSEGVNLAGEVIGDHQGAMDDILSQYMETVPVDPLYNGSNGQNDYFYSYDPQHAQSIEKGCTTVDEKHPLYKTSCNCSSNGTSVAVLAFNKSETYPLNLSIDTCAGTQMNISNAHYNISLFPAPQ